MKEQILIVDSEKEIADLIELYLKNDGYIVHKFYSGKEALECVRTTKLDLVILEVMLPDLDGFQVCRKIREEYLFPIIMLTTKDDDMDKIMGLTVGADDYITKPFNPLEVIVRIKAQLRRYKQYNQSKKSCEVKDTEYHIKGVTINKDTHQCTLFGKELNLTPLEFSILWYLCKYQSKVVSSEELFEEVWGEKSMDCNNTVMAHIGRLREKLKDSAKNPKLIKTIRGVGYKIEQLSYIAYLRLKKS